MLKEQFLKKIRETLQEAESYRSAALLLEFDRETLCPQKAREEQGQLEAKLSNQAFILRQEEGFQKALLSLSDCLEDLEEWDAAMVRHCLRQYRMEKNISPELSLSLSLAEKQAYLDLLSARQEKDYSLFKESLQKVIDGKKKKCSLRILTKEEETRMEGIYDMLLDENERGCTARELDPVFDELGKGLKELISKIQNRGKTVRTDFLKRPVSDEIQEQIAQKTADLLHFDRSRGKLVVTDQGFTQRIARDDIRMTTYIDPESFMSNVYTVLHESGHALFEQLQPEENSDYFLTGGKTQGMHESVSRYYENVLGRSEAFIHLIWPMLLNLIPETLSDVTERELFEAVNIVQPTLIRTEADEVTYSLHIIIRYELEKELFSGELSTEHLEEAWNDRYEKYLGIRPTSCLNGVLQDVHWVSDFGYFPTYALGNLYNAMYGCVMQKELDVDALIRSGDFETINTWMKDRVFKKADRLAPGEWIRDITGKSLTSKDYLDYLRKKYDGIYGLS